MYSKILLGIDIGTSACKVAAFGSDGTVLAQSAREYNVYYPEPGFVEQDPMEWWKRDRRDKRDYRFRKIKPDQIAGIGIDGQSWSAIPVDKDGNVLHNTPIGWIRDQRKFAGSN